MLKYCKKYTMLNKKKCDAYESKYVEVLMSVDRADRFQMRLRHDLSFGVVFAALVHQRYLEFREMGFDIVAIRYEDIIQVESLEYFE